MKRVIFAFGILVSCSLFAQSPKPFATKTNALDNFTGYKVDTNLLKLSRKNDFGKTYWLNTGVFSDIVVALFQKNYEVFNPPQGEAYCVFSTAICNGDFNNDGYIDVFNGGAAFNGKKANLSFLIWNTSLKKYEEKNLINDKTSFIGNPRLVTPLYLNSDDYIDLVIHGARDEGNDTNRPEPVRLCLSDGKGGYDLIKLKLEPDALASRFAHEGGDVADVNGDSYPDLFVPAGSHSYIFWGTPVSPYFTNNNFAHFSSDTVNFSSNNGFGEVVPSGAGDVYSGQLADIDNDGKIDLLLGGSEDSTAKIHQRLFINQGLGRFNNNKLIRLPLYTTFPNYTLKGNNGINQFEKILDDLNSDGLTDMITLNSMNYRDWYILVYTQQKDKTFKIDTSWFHNKINYTSNPPVWKFKLIYHDFDGDGKKDISYEDASITQYTDSVNTISTKKVYIRKGDAFEEQDFLKYDPYVKYFYDSIKGKPNCPQGYLRKPIFNSFAKSFCSGDSIKVSMTLDLKIDNILKGDSLKWYYGGKSDLTNVSSKTFTDSVKFYVIRKDSIGCIISSDTISITKNALPTIPIVNDVAFCQNINSSTLTAIGISGNTITWYGNNANGGSPSANASVASTSDTTTKSYYVSQINNTTKCESPRAKIIVKINPAPASPSVKDTAYCNNISADTLKATSLTGHTLNWYGNSATGGTASILGSKPATTTVGSFNYYVSQKNNTTGCDGVRAKIGVTINPLPIAPVVRDTNYCNNASSDTIRLNASSGATLLWYGTNATGGTSSTIAIKPTTATVGAANYYLSQIITATGCEGLRSKVVVTTKPIPSAPTLSRDTANFLLSGVPGTTWYKDGSAITDTAQKYKPTAAGSYTAKTTTNGCTSVMSTAYYFLITDILKLSSTEFIKLVPNPFHDKINFDFAIKGYQKLNLDVFEISTGNKVASRLGLTPGAPIYLPELTSGTYIVRITSAEGKLSYQFKMVKL